MSVPRDTPFVHVREIISFCANITITDLFLGDVISKRENRHSLGEKGLLLQIINAKPWFSTGALNFFLWHTNEYDMASSKLESLKMK